MSKKQKASAPKASSQSSASRRVFLVGVDPVALVNLLDNQYTDTGEGPDASPYRRLYEESKAAFLEQAGDVDSTISFAKLLDDVDPWISVEEAVRRAGFVVGFQTCRQLLLGELKLPVLKGDDGGVA